MSIYKTKITFKNGNSRTISVTEESNEITLYSFSNTNQRLEMTFGEEYVYGYIGSSFSNNVHYKMNYSDVCEMKFDKEVLKIKGNNELNNMKKEEFFCCCDEKAYEIICEKIKDNDKIDLNNWSKKGKRNNVITSIYAIVLGIVLLVGLIYWVSSFNQGSSNWNKLSDEEKEWYEDNYGDGKMDDINDAIDDYENK